MILLRGEKVFIMQDPNPAQALLAQTSKRRHRIRTEFLAVRGKRDTRVWSLYLSFYLVEQVLN